MESDCFINEENSAVPNRGRVKESKLELRMDGPQLEDRAETEMLRGDQTIVNLFFRGVTTSFSNISFQEKWEY